MTRESAHAVAEPKRVTSRFRTRESNYVDGISVVPTLWVQVRRVKPTTARPIQNVEAAMRAFEVESNFAIELAFAFDLQISVASAHRRAKTKSLLRLRDAASRREISRRPEPIAMELRCHSSAPTSTIWKLSFSE